MPSAKNTKMSVEKPVEEKPIEMPELITTAFPSNGQLLVEETEELLKKSVEAMKADLAKTPAWSGAPEPTDDFLLMFLRSEVFDPAKAADRFRKFWESKVDLFGEEKAAQPIKIEDVSVPLNKQFVQIIPGSKDIEGRQVVLVNPGNEDKSMDRKLRVRAVWYVLLAALEELETQRRGLCFVIVLKTAKFTQFDSKFLKMVLGSIQGVLPVRIGSMNITYPPSFFRVVWGILSVFIQERLKQRVRVIPGPDASVKETISSIVEVKHLPSPIGTKEVDFEAWMATRVSAEA